jgi:phage terminase Nu1 subunit (DNA packaging protein)
MKTKQHPIPKTVSLQQLARFLPIGERQIQELAKRGSIMKNEAGQYLFAESVAGYCEYAANKRKNQYDSGGESSPGGYEAERARLTRAKADMAEMQAETMRGTVHEAGAVEAVWTDMILNARSKILAIPRKLAPRIVGMAKVAEIETCLETECHAALTELSDYDPDVVLRKYEASKAVSLEEDDDGEELD